MQNIFWGLMWLGFAICFFGNHMNWWDIPLICDELRMAMTCGMVSMYAILCGLKKIQVIL